MRKAIHATLFALFLFITANATTYTVNTTSDANTGAGTTGTLRWCITQANSVAGADIINFAIAGAGPHTITVTSNFPVITEALTINGFSQTGAVQGQLGTGTRVMKIILDGPGSTAVYGLQISTNNCQISGLVIQDFFKGIQISGGDGNWIWGCYIGTSVNGLSYDINTSCYDDGLALVSNSDNNFIGTNGDGVNDANEGNLISANGDSGAQYAGESIVFNESGTITTNCTGNRIAGNFLGTNETGNDSLFYNRTINKQRGSGIQLYYSTANIIGTNGDGVSDALERNVISGNSDEGIVLVGCTTTKIKGNYIGTDKTGLIGLPNYINAGTDLITGQIVLKSASLNNFIGTDGDGVNDAIEGNVIGSATLTAAANSYSDGIDIIGASTGNRISGNLIGIGADGVTAVPILTTGTINDWAININSNNNIVGTNNDGVSDALEANYIGNSGSGVTVDNATGNIIAGNYFGLGNNLTTAAPLGYAGVYLYNAASNRIGSTASDADERNYFCNSSKYGVWIDGDLSAASDLNNIRYNTIGMRPDNNPAPNAWHGIFVCRQSNSNTIQYNIITRNGTGSATGAYAGVQIGSSTASEQSSSNTINNNTIYKNIGPGIAVVNASSITNLIKQNSLYDNGNASNATGKLKLGIDLSADGVTANDNLDADAGANGLTNFPVITGIIPSGFSCTNVDVAGTYNGLASTQYYVEVYQSDVCNGDTAGVDYMTTGGSNYGEGKVYLAASALFTTNASGNGTWTTTIPLSSVTGKYLTAIAIQTNGVAINSTSEFSMCYGAANDYGDAPNSYSTLAASCGATHFGSSSSLRIGATVDTEADGTPGTAATGDGADEDGLGALPTLHEKSTTYSLTNISVTNNTGTAATLYAWIDFDIDGAFEVGEFTSVAVPSSGTQTVTLTWNLATFVCGSTLKDGNSYIRLRLTNSTLADNGATAGVDERSIGIAGAGEVEDYALTIYPDDFGDLPNTYPLATALVYSAGTTGKVWLGNNVPVTECTPNYSADGFGEGTEEDGLTTSSGAPGANYNWIIRLNSNQAAKTVYYGFWIDWNKNSNFTDAFDAFYSGSAVITGATNVNKSVFLPYGSSPNCGIRVIVSENAVTSGMYNATILNSEVEDYVLLNVLANNIILTGRKQAGGNMLSWKNTAGNATTKIIIERSTDNNNWLTVNTISVNVGDQENYTWLDQHASDLNNQYRLKMIFSDGSFKYSNTVTINNSFATPIVKLYPNPATDVLFIEGNNCKTAEVLDLRGKVLFKTELNSQSSSINLRRFAPGTLMLRLSDKDGNTTTQKFMKM